jgi:hypothetical protein
LYAFRNCPEDQKSNVAKLPSKTMHKVVVGPENEAAPLTDTTVEVGLINAALFNDDCVSAHGKHQKRDVINKGSRRVERGIGDLLVGGSTGSGRGRRRRRDDGIGGSVSGFDAGSRGDCRSAVVSQI